MSQTPEPIDCRAAMRQLYDYLDGELSEANAELVRDHLERCQECFAHASFEREVLAVIRSGWQNIIASSELRQRIRGELRKAGFTG